MAIVDITVRGAGIFGLSIAWACVQRGARVTLVDPHGPCAGASGGIVGALAPHVPENWNDKKQFQFDSLVMAEAFWAAVEAVSGVAPGYARSGRIQPLVDDRKLALARARTGTARSLWQGLAVWTVANENPAPGWAPDSPTGHWVHDTLTARMSPRAAGASLTAALAARGVEVVADAPDRGSVIWASGVQGLADLSSALGQDVGNAVKGQSALFTCDARTLPQLFAGALHVIPHHDGTVAVGSTTERDFADPAATDDQLDALIVSARTQIPALAEAPVVERWAGLRPRARSRAPMLGSWPGRAGHFIANGGFKIGFGMAPKVAEVMADLVLERRDTIPDGFRVEASLR